MKKKKMYSFIFLSTVILGLLGGGFLLETAHADADLQPIYRVYNPNSGEHLYTPNGLERIILCNSGWKDENEAFFIPYNDNAFNPYVTRVFNPNANDHLYTTDTNEIFSLVKLGWKNDMVGFYTANENGDPVYRLYNPNALSGAHHYTLDSNERDHLVTLGWKDEGIAFRAYQSFHSL